jgi:hypothetical protein
MLGDGHVRFGGRSAETERPKGRHRAAGRPHNLTPRQQLKLAHIQKINQRLYRDRRRDRRCRRPPAQIPACASTHWAPP